MSTLGLVPWNKGKKGLQIGWNKGKKASPEACLHQSMAHLGQPSGNRGHRCTDEQRARMSIADKGRVVSPETRAKISAAHIGCIISSETRAKQSVAAKKRGLSESFRAVRMRGSRLGTHWSDEAKAKQFVSHWKGGRPVSAAKMNAKRRSMGYFNMNQWFDGAVGHHIDHERVIYMPRALHQGKGLSHNHWTGKGMARMNAVAFNFLFKQEVEAAMAKVTS